VDRGSSPSHEDLMEEVDRAMGSGNTGLSASLSSDTMVPCGVEFAPSS
jgi:hypothetical protein